jgi:glycosyltransferase involved in cell wall biosynthesis
VRVLIDTTYAQRAPHSGTAVYLERIIAALRSLADVEVVTAANAARRPPGGGPAASVANAAADMRWTEHELPRRARAAGAQLIHHPLPAHAQATRLAQVVTVHDLAFERLPDRFSPAFRRWAHLAHRHATRHAGAVICPSETTAADARELWAINPATIVVARHGPGEAIDPPLPRADPPRHFLYIGDAEPRKDLPTLLAAHRAYAERTSDPLPLVLAGSAHVHQTHVKIESRPTAPRLAQLLAQATALVHPALYEGFGLTLLEAMAAGAPVIAAAVPGTTETCGDAARYVTPGDAGELAAALAELAGDPARGQRLAVRGRARAATFSWNLAARAHRDAYSVALA